MRDADERFQIGVSCLTAWFLISLLAHVLPLAQAQSQQESCFSIDLVRDGKPVDGLASVTVHDEGGGRELTRHDGKFCIPKEMTERPALDLSFVVGKERFYFPRIPRERYTVAWEVAFGGRAYAYQMGLPKSTRPDRACTVTFREGEPEVSLLFSACRSTVSRQ